MAAVGASPPPLFYRFQWVYLCLSVTVFLLCVCDLFIFEQVSMGGLLVALVMKTQTGLRVYPESL